MPGIARGALGFFPVQPRLALGALVLVAQRRLVGVVALAGCLCALPPRVSRAIRRRIVVIGVARLVPGRLVVVAAPVVVLGRGVDAFGRALAGEPARDGTDGTAHHGA